MERYCEYKDSGVQWLGEIPGHWKAIPVRRIAQVNPSKKKELFPDDYVGYAPMERIRCDQMIPTRISANDMRNYIDILYSYSETRNSSDVDGVNFKHVNKEDITSFISEVVSDNDSEQFLDNIVDGLYNLKLPANIFGKKGFYTIYIKPREVPVTIMDVSTLKDFPNVRGIVLDLKTLRVLQENI